MNAKEHRNASVFYATVLVYEDGTLVIMDSDIKGFFIQAKNLHELFVESKWVASELLNLTDETTGSTLELKFEFVVEDEPHIKTIPIGLSAPIVLEKKEMSRSLELA